MKKYKKFCLGQLHLYYSIRRKLKDHNSTLLRVVQSIVVTSMEHAIREKVFRTDRTCEPPQDEERSEEREMLKN